ncbi:Exportin-1, partial [Cymbomonas tetramitiformis]
LEYLLGISYIDDTEVLKVCLDYWNHLVCDLFQSECNQETLVRPQQFAFSMGAGPVASVRKQLFSIPLSKLRLLMVSRMAKPEEVLIVEDEDGNIVRETMKDGDVLAQYKQMRETLVCLSHLDQDDTQSQMLEKLALQLNGKEYSWTTLNCLCWAIGSISGSMMEEQENKFLVTVIRDLLNLCEYTRGKDHKAVIASNIMYVVGQYPRFLRAHWKFLKTVVNKLFEFMHETHPGVQDMACDTFLKIAKKCKRKFVITNPQDSEPFISELLNGLGETIKDLEAHQIHIFYEAVGEMIHSELDLKKKEDYINRLMTPPNTQWFQLITQATANPDILRQQDVIRNVANILQTNVYTCQSLGQAFQMQISLLFSDMLQVYKLYSEFISTQVATGGQFAARTTQVKLMRSVKRECLKLIETFVDKTDDPKLLATQLVPSMLDPILGDYQRNVADARDAEVLSLFTAIFNKVGAALTDAVPRVFEACFQCTLQMITQNFEDYPEHRPKFFALLRAVTNNCFQALLTLSPDNLQLIINSIVWAFRHTERNVAETGLILLLELLQQFQKSEFMNQFHQTYFLTIVQEIFAVMTDTFHKPGFKLHAQILQHMLQASLSPQLSQPLWDVAGTPGGAAAYPNNAAFVRQHIIQLLTTAFPNVSAPQVTLFMDALFEAKNDLSAFKDRLRDFLVQSREFNADGGTNAELWAEETAAKQELEKAARMAIPGMQNPNEIQDDMAAT